MNSYLSRQQALFRGDCVRFATEHPELCDDAFNEQYRENLYPHGPGCTCEDGPDDQACPVLEAQRDADACEDDRWDPTEEVRAICVVCGLPCIGTSEICSLQCLEILQDDRAAYAMSR